MTLRNRVKIPTSFDKAVKEYGNPDAKAPSGFGDNKGYVNCWDNWWLVEQLYKQWKYIHAIANDKKPARNWFLPYDHENATDWKTTTIHIMNAEYAGNASYEWFEWREDENGEKQMYRINQFDRIKDTSDPRLHNPALSYIFSHPKMTVAQAFREFKKTLSEKKN